MKNQTKNLKNVILTLTMVVLGAALLGCSTTGDTDKRKTGEIPMPDEIIEASELLKNIDSRYGGDREIEKYREKFIAIRGLASSVIMSKSGDGSGSLLFKAEGSKVKGISCDFTKADAEQFSQIKSGQSVTVKGLFTTDAFLINLKPCQVVKVE